MYNVSRYNVSRYNVSLKHNDFGGQLQKKAHTAHASAFLHYFGTPYPTNAFNIIAGQLLHQFANWVKQTCSEYTTKSVHSSQ